MAVLIFKLRNVPDDEAEDIRQLLQGHALEFYETTAGNWGLSMPALWLHNDDDAPRARALITTYQSQRARRMREQYEIERASGQSRTLVDTFRQRPFATLGILAFCLALVYIMVKPFLSLISAGAP